DDKGLIKIDKQCRTNVKNIYAIGDIVDGLPLAHKASYEGKVAAEAISGKKTEIDYIGMPAVVFSDPEMASVGYTEQQAKDENIDGQVGKFPFAANGRAVSSSETEGCMKLISRREDGSVSRGQIVGANASDMLAAVGLATEAGT